MALPEGSELIRLTDQHNFKPFDCGDTDLNEFLKKDSIPHLKKLLAVTYVLQNEEHTICFFSLLNDKITIKEAKGNDEKSKWRLLFSQKTGKNYGSHPAMKIGRFGVTNNYRNTGIGRIIIDYIKELFITNNRTGCRFITVDAYYDSLVFYEKMGFKYMTEADADSKTTRHMYFDLIELSEISPLI
jgi:predicted GNAT family N-acyltransferase